jgi:RNA polymerase sigma-70 factor, ECF subfamily
MENRGYRQKTDEELMILCEADGEAFGELARRYQPVAFRAAYCMLRNSVDAEDQVQAAFCKAFEHIGNFERRAKFSTWLIRIVINECLMQMRRSRRAGAARFSDCHWEALPAKDARCSPEALMRRLVLAKVLRREIRCIPPLFRNVFVLREIERKPMSEVAAELGISVAAAKSRLCRAREELRRRLEPHVLEHVLAKPASETGTN